MKENLNILINYLKGLIENRSSKKILFYYRAKWKHIKPLPFFISKRIFFFEIFSSSWVKNLTTNRK